MTGGQASVDPEALRSFADELMTLVSAIRSTGEELDAGLANLGRTFQDEHYHEFRTVFVHTRQTLVAFADEVTGLLPGLRADADDISAGQRVTLD